MILICPTLKPHEAWMKQEEAAKFKTDDKSERKQGYSDRDATHSTGLPAAGEWKMLFMCHTWKIFIP
jgi:hypothetical protein